jgi:hypothetical protein
VNGELALSRAFGDAELKVIKHGHRAPVVSAEPDVTEYPLTPRDRFMVLACDGLWDVYTNDSVGAMVWKWLQQGLSASTIAVNLVQRAIRERTQQDNVSAIVVTFWPPEEPPDPGRVRKPKQRKRQPRGSPGGRDTGGSEPDASAGPQGTQGGPEARVPQDGGEAMVPDKAPGQPDTADTAVNKADSRGTASTRRSRRSTQRNKDSKVSKDTALRTFTCAPPAGSTVVAGITVVPAPPPPDSAKPLARVGVRGCAPPPGSSVVDGITRVPPPTSTGPSDAEPTTQTSRRSAYGCDPPPGSTVVDGVTRVGL